MPIYAYKCESCGHAKDVLQKMSDEPLSVCPACGQPSFRKQLTAAGFQLKGSGWYVTDFREGSKPAASSGSDAASTPKADKPAEPTSAAAAPAPASAPAATPAAPAASS
jgi:putative FmdB family regulatory protein